MVIKIDKVREEGIDVIDVVLSEYIEAIRRQMFTIDTISNNYNVIEKAGLTDSINEIINNENELINSYIDNILVSFQDSLRNFKEYKDEIKK